MLGADELFTVPLRVTRTHAERAFAEAPEVVTELDAEPGHHHEPAVVGVITAELLSALFWVAIGIAYYFITGQRPKSYAIFPL